MVVWSEALRGRWGERSWYPWLIFVFIASGAFIVNIDSTSINVALPTIQEQFHLRPSALQWVMTAYLLVVTGLLPTIGMLGDMTGRKRIFMTGMAVLAGGSVLCSLAANITQLILFRIVQAFGGAMIMANVSALITETFPQGQRGRPLGILTSIAAIGTIVGPAVGGVLIDWFSWRMVFWINVPICIFSLIGTFFFLPAKRPAQTKKSFDRLGSIMFFVAMASLLLYVSNVQDWGWSSAAGLLTGVTAFVAWIVFIRLETKHENPLIDLSFFKRPMFALGTLSGYISYILLFIPAVIMPLYMHNVLSISPTHIGLLLTSQAVAMIVAAPVSGWLSDKFNIHIPTLIGMALLAAGLWMMAQFDTATGYGHIIAALSVFGLGFGFFNSANNLSIIESVPSAQTGVAAGLVATMRNFGRVSGVAFAILLLDLGLKWNVNYDSATALTFYAGSFLAASTMLFLMLRLISDHRTRTGVNS